VQYVTIRVRVRRELWDKARRYRIDVDEVVERALVEEVARREEGVSVFESARRILERVPEEEIVRLIRLAREEE